MSPSGEGCDSDALLAVHTIQESRDELDVELLHGAGILACRLLAVLRHNLIKHAQRRVGVLQTNPQVNIFKISVIDGCLSSSSLTLSSRDCFSRCSACQPIATPSR